MSLTDFAIIRRSMGSRRFSTITTIAMVAISVALMLTLLSMREAAQESFRRGSGNMHLLVSGDSSRLVAVLNAVFHAGAPDRPLPWTQILRMQADPRLDYVIPIQQGDSYRGLPVLATTREFFTHFSPDPSYVPLQEADAEDAWRRAWPFRAGRPFDQPLEVAIGAEAARLAGLALGDRIFLTHGRGESGHVHRDFQFEVVGVLGPTGSAHDRAVFVDLRASWLIHASERLAAGGADVADLQEDDISDADRQVTGAYLRCITRAGSRVSTVLPEVAYALRRNPSLTVAEPRQEIDNLFRIVANIDRILIAMAAVVMLASGASIMLALYNSMEQRRRQTATLRVLGASAGRILRLVLIEAALLGAAGAIAGIALSAVGSIVVAEALEGRLGVVIGAQIRPLWALLVGLSAVAISSLGGLAPAVLAYRTGVANNLRPLG
jgi:putative ABC transport system permease protein